MTKSAWTQYRAIVQPDYIDITLDTALEDSNDWTNFDTAYRQYRVFKTTGLNTKIQVREVMLGTLKETEVEAKALQ